MNKINKVIEESNKEFESLIYESNYIRRGSYDYRLLKSFISQRDQKILSAIEEEVEGKQFQMDIKDYLPKVKAWKSGYDQPFDDGYAQSKSDIQALLKSAKEIK